MTKEDDAAIAAAAFAALSGLEEKLLELERFASRPAPEPPDNGGANRPGIAHAVAADRAIATEGEVWRVQELNVELRDRIRTLVVDLQMSRAREASAVEGARLARDFARAEDEVREATARPEVEALRAELEKANEAVRRSEAHASVAAKRSHEADRLEILLAERETERSGGSDAKSRNAPLARRRSRGPSRLFHRRRRGNRARGRRMERRGPAAAEPPRGR